MAQGAKDVIVAVPFQDEAVWFALHYVGVKVCLLSPDRSGRYITVKPNGQLALGPTSPGRSEEFYLKLVNRPLLILESEFGFVASAPGMHRLDANRTSYEVIKTRALDSGYYHFQNVSTGMYWAVDREGTITSTGNQPSNFTIEFVSSNSLVIGAPSGKYVVADQGGGFKALGFYPSCASLFQY
ncbi:fascin-like [Latimeria chalumnae]|uniref:fascin-like n=1 Tax=Latimeria chalumnae TaxID=7897 RepID=UPI00313E8B3E